MTPTTADGQFKKLGAYQDRVPGHRDNSRVHLSTLIRWCTRGVQLPDGSRLRLRAARVGNRWLTTDPWFEEFVAALTAAHSGGEGPAASGSRSPADRRRASDHAARQLEDMGA